jgi:hypothetical protein
VLQDASDAHPADHSASGIDDGQDLSTGPHEARERIVKAV